MALPTEAHLFLRQRKAANNELQERKQSEMAVSIIDFNL